MEMTVDDLGEGAMCVALRGRLDTVGVDKVEPRFTAAVAASKRHTALDLGAVTFLSSMGVRMIIATARQLKAQGRMLVLFGAQPLVLSTLKMVALDQIIPIVADRAQAKARLAP